MSRIFFVLFQGHELVLMRLSTSKCGCNYLSSGDDHERLSLSGGREVQDSQCERGIT